MSKKHTLEQIEAFQKNTMTDQLGIKITDYGNNYIWNQNKNSSIWMIY